MGRISVIILSYNMKRCLGICSPTASLHMKREFCLKSASYNMIFFIQIWKRFRSNELWKTKLENLIALVLMDYLRSNMETQFMGLKINPSLGCFFFFFHVSEFIWFYPSIDRRIVDKREIELCFHSNKLGKIVLAPTWKVKYATRKPISFTSFEIR